MKALKSYINIRKKPSTTKATDDTIKQIVKGELDRLGHDCDLNHIDVSDVMSMYDLFNCKNYGWGLTYSDLNPDITGWNVSNVKIMGFMFYSCKNFNQDISGWDVSNVENMAFMFDGCRNFNQDISKWDVSNVKCRNFMFIDCPLEEEFKPKFKNVES